MKTFSLGMVLLFASSAIAVEIDKNDENTGARTVVVSAVGDSATAAAEGEAVVRVATDDGNDSVHVVRFITSTDGEGTPEQVKVHARAVAVGNDPNRGWLGVALAETTTSDDGDEIVSGVTINNVVVDSPAEAAGLQKGDQIISIDGQTVDNLADVVTRIGEQGPGAVLTITVDRNGQTITTDVTLSGPPEKWEWIDPVDGLKLRDTIKLNKIKTIQISPDGNVEIGSLDDVADLHDKLSGAVVRALQDSLGNISVNVDVSNDDSNRKVRINAVRDGESVTIEQDNDGPISVTRDGEVIEYATVEELESADPDAAELYNQSKGDVHNFSFSFGDNFDWTSEDFGDRIKVELEALQNKLGDAGEDYNVLVHPHAMVFSHGKAMRTFRVNPDGQIELTIRTGEDEVVQVYRDAADLEARDPEMYDKYADVLDADAGNE